MYASPRSLQTTRSDPMGESNSAVCKTSVRGISDAAYHSSRREFNRNASIGLAAVQVGLREL